MPRQSAGLVLYRRLTGALEVFLEAYNVLNSVNFENPSGVITSGSFATYTTAPDARQIQWGARIQF